MNATEINQRLQEINMLLTYIIQKLKDIKMQEELDNI